MVKELNHVGVNVKNLKETLAFYEEHFGAKFVRGLYIPSSQTIGAYVQIGSSLIEFLSPLYPDESFKSGIAHLAFIVDDLEEASSTLKEKGYKFFVQPKTAGSGGGKLAFFYEPNGASIELIERCDSFKEEWTSTTETIEIDHFSVFADNLSDAIDFYTKELNMDVVVDYHFEEKKFDMVYLNKGKDILELLHTSDVHKEDLFSHIALRVSNAQQLSNKLEEKGVTILNKPRLLATENGYVCNITDPNGIVLELIDRDSLFNV